MTRCICDCVHKIALLYSYMGSKRFFLMSCELNPYCYVIAIQLCIKTKLCLKQPSFYHHTTAVHTLTNNSGRH